MRKKYFWPIAIIIIMVGVYFAQVIIPSKSKKRTVYFTVQDIKEEEFEMIQNLSSSDKKLLDSLLIEN